MFHDRIIAPDDPPPLVTDNDRPSSLQCWLSGVGQAREGKRGATNLLVMPSSFLSGAEEEGGPTVVQGKSGSSSFHPPPSAHL